MKPLLSLIIIGLSIFGIVGCSNSVEGQAISDGYGEIICDEIIELENKRGFVASFDIIHLAKMVARDTNIDYMDTAPPIFSAVKEYCPTYYYPLQKTWKEGW